MSRYQDRETILRLLSERLTPVQYYKITTILDLQERVSEGLKKRNKLLRNLKKFIESQDYRKVSLALDLTEEMVNQSRDRLTTLENRALINCESAESFNYKDWLKPAEFQELMELQNEEARAFQVPLPYPLESIQEFQLQPNL